MEREEPENVVMWIIESITPYSDNLDKLVLKLCVAEGVYPSADVHKKLVRYIEFFCKIVEK